MDVNESKAQVVSVDFGRSFAEIAEDAQRRSVRRITFDDGKRVKLDPTKEYSIMLVETESLLSSEEFAAFAPYIRSGIVKAVADGVITKERIQNIATVFSIPKQPAFPFNFPEGAGVDTYIEGTVALRYEWVPPPCCAMEESENTDEQ